MSIVVNQVRMGLFLDSVVLMQISRSLNALEGVEEAALMIGTPSNVVILEDAGLLSDAGRGVSGGDLVIAIRASHEMAAKAAIDEATALLDRPNFNPFQGEAFLPRTLRSARTMMPTANLALISVPGDFAAGEARKALRLGMNVMLFSDNVPIEEEVALKREADQVGLLMLGPDCGTAIIGGVPLAFANSVPRGDIGLVGASGTGLQEVSTLVSRLGSGISHAIGVGGRDLTDAVGGRGALAAIRLLTEDAATRHIVLLSKAPSAVVAERILEVVAETPKTFSLCFLGGGSFPVPANSKLLPTLKSAAEHAVGRPLEEHASCLTLPVAARVAGRSRIYGLFTGGSLAAEAQVIFLERGEPVASNAPVPGADLQGTCDKHVLLDLGDDNYTRGRPHPMIEPEIRDGLLRAALVDATIAVILVDVVIGYGAHGDPAASITHLLDGAPADRPLVIASVTGTDNDPQIRASQVRCLSAAGAVVAPSNADAALLALECAATSR